MGHGNYLLKAKELTHKVIQKVLDTITEEHPQAESAAIYQIIDLANLTTQSNLIEQKNGRIKTELL